MKNTRKDKVGACAPKNRILRAALALTRKGVPVFPCKPGDKSPHYRKGLIEHGFMDATTDRDTAIRFWREWPTASIGVPTGEVTGRFVLDVDVREGFDGLANLAELELKHGKLPETLTIRTLNGGLHLHFQYPGYYVPNRTGTGALLPGVEVKGDGGYVVTAPSVGYEIVNESAASEAPAWLLRMILKKPAGMVGAYEQGVSAGSSPNFGEPAEFLTMGDPIKSGYRNDSLFSIAMNSRRRGVGEEHLLGFLKEVNRRRCSPPLTDGEVLKIARSALKTKPKKLMLSGEARAVLDEASRELDTHRWCGMAGKTDRSVYRALIQTGRKFGLEIAAGVRVSISVRDLALMAGIAARTVIKATNRLESKGLIRRDKSQRLAKEAGAWIILRAVPDRNSTEPGDGAQDGHIRTVAALSSYVECTNVAKLRNLAAESLESAAYLRWGQGALGKSKEEILDILSRADGGIELVDLARTVGVRRERDLKRRHLNPLVEMEVLSVSDEDGKQIYALAVGWDERLKEIRRQNGEALTSHRAARDFERERRAFAKHLSDSSKGRFRKKTTTNVRNTPVQSQDGSVDHTQVLKPDHAASGLGETEGVTQRGVEKNRFPRNPLKTEPIQQYSGVISQGSVSPLEIGADVLEAYRADS